MLFVNFSVGKSWFSVLASQTLQYGGSSLPCNFTSLIDLQRVCFFFLLRSAFTCLEDKMAAFKLLAYQTGNRVLGSGNY